jgi:predicted Zn-dependent protease
MKFLRKSILWIILLAAIGMWVYRDLNPITACQAPLKYTLGTFDSRFKISKADFQGAIDEATTIWENATGKNLFAFDANPPVRNDFQKYLHKYVLSFFIRDDIPVNLVYDERQQLSQQRQGLLSDINTTKESAESVKRDLTAKQEEYRQEAALYQTMVAQYKARNPNVTYEAVEAKRLEVNNLADEVNVLVKKYNSFVGEINATVKTVNQTAGQEFEEGQYVSDENGERINIYEFNSHQTLVRVLAHELGHAIGLAHNENPDSIMYYLNNSKKMTPTKDDLAALSAICKGK